MKNNKKILFEALRALPEHVVDKEILSFYNPYKEDYRSVIHQIKTRNLYTRCIKQLKSFNTYCVKRNFIQFRRDAILSSIET